MSTTLDDFDDSVMGDLITYARCEHFPGSESPVSWPVYAWPSGSTFLLDPTVFQTVLALGTSSLPPAGTSAAAPPIDVGDNRDRTAGLSMLEAYHFRMRIRCMACRFIILGF